MKYPNFSRLLALTVLSLNCWLPAQEAPVLPPVAAPQVSPPAAVTAPAPESPAGPAVVEPLRVERRVFVPYEELEATMKDQGQGVFLPYREFLEMWNQLATQREKVSSPPPSDGLLVSAAYTGKISEGVAVIDAVLQVESFKEGWAVLPLGGKGLSIASAVTGEATLRQGEAGMEVIVPKKGRYELKLQVFAKIQRSTGKQSVVLNLPRTAVSRLELAVPETGWDFSTDPPAAFTAQPSADGQGTQFAVIFGEGAGMTLTWQKAGGESKLTPLVFADTAARCELAPGALHTTLTVNYSILRAGVSEFEMAVPMPHEVLSVQGDNIKEWNVEKPATDSQPQILKVNLHAPAKNALTLTLDLEAPVEALPATLQVPQVEVRQVVRQRGNVEINAAAELDTEARDAQGLAQQAVADAGKDGAKALIGNWRYLKLPWALTLHAKKAEPVVEAVSFTNYHVAPDTLSFSTRMDYTIKRAGIFETRIQLPAGWDNLDVKGGAVDTFTEETTGEGAAARRTLLVRLKNRVEGATSFDITGRMNRTGDADAPLPVFAPQGVARHDALVGVQVDETLDANTKVAGGLKQEDVSRVMERNAAIQPPDAKLPPVNFTIGFRYRGEVEPAVLSLKTKKPQVSGEVLTLTEIREQSIVYHWWLNWDVLYSGVDSFVISVPRALAADIRVETRTLKEVDKAWKPAAGADAAREYWRIEPRTKAPGRFTVELAMERPLGSLEAGKNTSVEVPEIALLDLFQETGEIVVVKSGNLEVQEPEKSAALEPVDPQDVAAALKKPGVFLAWKWKSHPATVKLPVYRNELVEVPQSIVTYASFKTAVSTDLAVTTEAVYFVRNNTQQYFTVKLPEGGRMLSDVTVNGKSQQPQHRADKSELLIRLPSAQEQRQRFAVRFVYDVPSPHAGKGLGENGRISVAPVELLDATILESQSVLYLPSGYVWQDFESAMQLSAAERGWSKVRRRLGWLVPALGPQVQEKTDNSWARPPELQATDRGLFDFQLPKDGQSFDLHRLDKPAAIAASYRSRRLEHSIEAVGVVLGLGIGFLLRRRGAGVKMGYLLFGGVGALVLDGALGSSAGGFLRYFFAGVMLAAGLWVLRAFVRTVRPRRAVAEKTRPVGSASESPVVPPVAPLERPASEATPPPLMTEDAPEPTKPAAPDQP